jgi:hypothetical protein
MSSHQDYTFGKSQEVSFQPKLLGSFTLPKLEAILPPSMDLPATFQTRAMTAMRDRTTACRAPKVSPNMFLSETDI